MYIQCMSGGMHALAAILCQQCRRLCPYFLTVVINEYTGERLKTTYSSFTLIPRPSFGTLYVLNEGGRPGDEATPHSKCQQGFAPVQSHYYLKPQFDTAISHLRYIINSVPRSTSMSHQERMSRQRRRRSVELRILASAEVVCIHASQIFYLIWQEAYTHCRPWLARNTRCLHVPYYSMAAHA